MIKVENLYKTYGKDVRALCSVNFEVRPGEICGYIGTNGAGKSTTLKILCGMMDYDEGNVEVRGLKLPDESNEVKEITGYVPESADMFNSLTVKEYFRFIGDVRCIQADTIIRRSNISRNYSASRSTSPIRLENYRKGINKRC